MIVVCFERLMINRAPASSCSMAQSGQWSEPMSSGPSDQYRNGQSAWKGRRLKRSATTHPAPLQEMLTMPLVFEPVEAAWL
jgi:hypothetical protein